jgi:DNA-binding NarL/FixJ family response regulator
VDVIRIVLVDDQELVRTGFRLVLSGQPDMEVVGEAGASGFLLKDTGARNLIDGIRIVHSGDAVVAPSVTRRLLDRFTATASPVRPAGGQAVPGVPLTAREVEVLREVALGLSNAEIAERMFLSEATVRTHVSHILGKLGLRDRVQAVVYAYEMRLVRAGA